MPPSESDPAPSHPHSRLRLRHRDRAAPRPAAGRARLPPLQVPERDERGLQHDPRLQPPRGHPAHRVHLPPRGLRHQQQPRVGAGVLHILVDRPGRARADRAPRGHDDRERGRGRRAGRRVRVRAVRRAVLRPEVRPRQAVGAPERPRGACLHVCLCGARG